MKKLTTILVVLAFLFSPAFIFAQDQQGQSDQQSQQGQQSDQQGQQSDQQGQQSDQQGQQSQQSQQDQTLGSGQQSGLPQGLMRVSNLSNMSLTDSSGQNVGSVQDVILGSDGKVNFIIADLQQSASGVSQAGMYLVPTSMLQMQGQQLQVNLQSGQQLQMLDPSGSLQGVSQVAKDSVKAKTLLSYPVKDQQGQDVGSIEDIVLDLGQQKVQYVAVAPTMTLGSGNQYVAVPYDDVWYNLSSKQVTLTVSEQQLQSAQGFSQDNWPQSASQNLQSAGGQQQLGSGQQSQSDQSGSQQQSGQSDQQSQSGGQSGGQQSQSDQSGQQSQSDQSSQQSQSDQSSQQSQSDQSSQQSQSDQSSQQSQSDQSGQQQSQ